ncbi:phospho-N-acetylmuramoyl-pentapeptide transferase [[Clostridium] ultunense Esp]|nr:phospho-N-acetylmuramoyl-pentapeptide transferase [[Clostridium] ultunense Esp]
MVTRVILFTLIAAFLVAVLMAPLLIPLLRRLKFGQSIREEGPKSHYKKKGTPTMGGIIIILAFAIPSFQFAYQSMDLFLVMFATLGYGLIGFLDDFIKILFKRNLGLTARQKLFGQVTIAVIFYIMLVRSGYSTELIIPGWNIHLELSWLYLPFILLLFLASSNAVNLTDGLDGLLAGTAAIAFAAYAVIAISLTKFDLAIFSAAVVGSLLGFLVFNHHPAKVFMGDTGSLSLGGALGALAILTKTELLLLLIGGIFVIETLSVILQVISFKTRGKRIFRMSPIHHHFELLGWSEWRVVITFWLVELLFATSAIYFEVFS